MVKQSRATWRVSFIWAGVLWGTAACAAEVEDAPDVLESSAQLTLPTLVRDHDFGAQGTKFVPLSAGLRWANAVAVQGGLTVVAGHPGSRESFAIARYTSDGQLDGSFRGGTLTGIFPSNNSEATEVAYQSDAKIIVAGHSTDSAGHHCYAALRLLPSGAADTGFGTYVRPIDTDPSFRPVPGVRVCFGGDALVQAMALQPDGKVVLAGSARPTQADPVSAGVVRLTSRGALDTGFHGDGIAQRGNVGLTADALGIQSDGKIVVAGRVGSDFAVERYLADGSFDTTFNQNRGISVIKFVTPPGVQSPDSTTTQIAPNAALQSRVISLAIDAQDRIVLAGQAHGHYGFEYNFGALARLSPAGALDTSFGTSGRVLTLVAHELGTAAAPAEPARFADFSAVSTSSSGAVLAVGSYAPLLGTNEFFPAIFRYDARGVLLEKKLDTFAPAGSSFWPMAAFAAPFVSQSQLVTIVGLARSNGVASSGLMRYRNGRPLVLSPQVTLELPLP